MANDLTKLLEVEAVRPKKYISGNKQIVIMPSPIQKKDFIDYKYGADIDEKVVKMATSLAERMAVSLLRESLSISVDAIVNKVVSSLVDRLSEIVPEQTTVIQQVASDVRKEAAEFSIEGAELSVDRSKGLTLHGKVGTKVKEGESTDNTLDALDNL